MLKRECLRVFFSGKNKTLLNLNGCMRARTIGYIDLRLQNLPKSIY